MSTINNKEKLPVVVFVLLLLLTIQISTVKCQECTADGTKCDKHERCEVWRNQGECVANRLYMLQHCAASCATDDIDTNFHNVREYQEGDICEDKHKFCSIWAENDECDENDDMKRFCPKSCKECGSDDTRELDEIDDEESDKRVEDEDDEDEDEASDEYFDSMEVLCENDEIDCELWASEGECVQNPEYMEEHCAKACNTCGKRLALYEDLAEKSIEFGKKQAIESDSANGVALLLQETIQYLIEARTKQLPKQILETCRNKNKLCTFWAFIGECKENAAYMATNCAPACKSCDMMDVKTRCPPLDDAKPALRAGDLNRMFDRILRTAPGNRTLTSDEMDELKMTKTPIYTVYVHSRPSNDIAPSTDVEMDKSLPPWVVTFDNFLTDEECNTLIQLGHERKYKRSKGVGELSHDGTAKSIKDDGRTSENAWCSDRDGCRSHEVPTRIHQRIASIINIPPENSEDLQLLKYEVGQFYLVHHDYITHQADLPCGPRILTFFLYLNDVEGGGGTNFPTLDITIMPKRGRALLWPSILNSEPMTSDLRTDHQALNVTAGIKFASNAWIHMYDYVAANKRGCT